MPIGAKRSDREEEPADRWPDELVQDDLRRRYLGVRLVQVFRGNRLRQDSKGGAVGQRFNESDRREGQVEDRHRHRARQLQYAQDSEDNGLGEVGKVQQSPAIGAIDQDTDTQHGEDPRAGVRDVQRGDRQRIARQGQG